MSGYSEYRDEIDVPRGTGVQGFLRAIEKLLKLPLIHEVKIDARGKVTYMRYLREGETGEPLQVDFDTLQPFAVIRNSGKIVELEAPLGGAALTVAQMFNAVAKDQLHPVAFVGGGNTTFFDWYKSSTGILLNDDSVYGFPFFRDRMVEDYMLFLVAAYGRQASLIDVQRSYKILMPQRVVTATQVSPP